MRIVFDMQGAQTESRLHGIGRYTLSLVKAIVRNRDKHEIIIALSDLFPETIEPIRAAFGGLLPQENIRVWSAPGPVCEREPGNAWRREAAELLREAFLASLQPDVVQIMSVFEGYMDDAVTSIGRFDHSTPVSVTLYDFIPLLNPGYYLKSNPAYEQHYLRKTDHIKRASLFLAISESSRQEGIVHFGLPSESVINISTAVDDCFRPLELNWGDVKSVLNMFSITRPFLLCTGVFNERNNLSRLIRAYAQLSTKLRKAHQLVFAGQILEDHLNQLRQEAKVAGLYADEIIFAGYVCDEGLVKLYNLSKLFVLPSSNEGFGLPALEAMSCGRAVIGANTSSMPEIIGREDALFDPRNEKALTAKLKQVLKDDNFRAELEQHGLEQARKFSLDECATKVMAAFERFHNEQQTRVLSTTWPIRRTKLAYVSPLPPERSGIADYSAELLSELSRHYDIDVIVSQKSISDASVNAVIPIRDVKWFRTNAHHYDRVLYHFGNSPFHQHMFSLLEKIPGVVVLHDFFLSHVLANMDNTGFAQGLWTTELYRSHGYKAVMERFQTNDIADAVFAYPCNLVVLQNAQGIIVHSEISCHLANQWYGEKVADEWAVIPSLSVPVNDANRQTSRHKLGLNDNDFIVCSFGMLGPTKLNDRLLDAYLASKLAKRKGCVLIFVGENHGGEHGAKLLEKIYANGMKDRIRITGWADDDTFRHYLAAADIGVQLRTLSRGETSRAVLDCMSHGLATIVNAHGSMVDLPDDGVWKLPDEFSDAQLVNALESLWRDPARRRQLGERGIEIIHTQHSSRSCADRYADSIERFYSKATTDIHALAKAIGYLDVAAAIPPEGLTVLARDSARSIPPCLVPRQLLVDVSELAHHDRKDGIHRVVRSILQEWLTNPPAGFRVEPVYATPDQNYRYARRFTLEFLGCPINYLNDEPIEYRNGDIFFGLDWHHHITLSQWDFYQQLRRWGIRVQFLVHDLLPIQMPQHFPDGMAEMHSRWLKVVAESDGAICVSKTVADELSTWIKTHGPKRLRPFKVSWSHPGANIDAAILSNVASNEAESTLQAIQSRPAFLMVSTIEPRKGHAQTLAAFEQLWREGVNANLVIVGAEGWKDLPEDMRRTIPSIVNRLRHHPELGKRLFWLEGISDEYLEKVYVISTCLIAASEGEGFGLPLIEAAQHKLPIIARDIPVFREVAREHAFYFQGLDPESLAQAIKQWYSLSKVKQVPYSEGMPWLTWKESAIRLFEAIKNRDLSTRV